MNRNGFSDQRPAEVEDLKQGSAIAWGTSGNSVNHIPSCPWPALATPLARRKRCKLRLAALELPRHQPRWSLKHSRPHRVARHWEFHVVQANLLSAVPPAHQVIQSPRILDAEFARHGERLKPCFSEYQSPMAQAMG
jgi:hypothetical protein